MYNKTFYFLKMVIFYKVSIQNIKQNFVLTQQFKDEKR